MADEEQKQEPTEVYACLELPDGAIVQNSVFIVAYYDSAGAARYGFNIQGECSLSHSLGLLDIVKAHMISEAQGG